MIDVLLEVTFWTGALGIAISLALAAMCGALTERAGVIDLALEAKLLFGAFGAAAFGVASGSPYVAILGGMAAGMLVALLQITCALRLGADQVIVGVALNLLALGGTRYLLQLLYGEGANSPKVEGFGAGTPTNPILWLALVAAIALPFALTRTRWGLRLRAAGDRPDALVAVGVSPTWVRLSAALVGGALAGAGGAQLTLQANGFVADSSAGRGYMALAMVILAGWRPWLAALACFGIIALAEETRIQLDIAAMGLPQELTRLIPYVLTLLVLLVYGGKHGNPPRSLGKP